MVLLKMVWSAGQPFLSRTGAWATRIVRVNEVTDNLSRLENEQYARSLFNDAASNSEGSGRGII
jgi:hypothetical protein